METEEGSIRATLPWNLPIDQRAFEPLGTLTNPARIGCRHLAEDGSLSGVYHHPQTQLDRLGECPLHRHRTMPNRPPV